MSPCGFSIGVNCRILHRVTYAAVDAGRSRRAKPSRPHDGWWQVMACNAGASGPPWSRLLTGGSFFGREDFRAGPGSDPRAHGLRQGTSDHLRMLDADAEGTDWREVVRIVLHIDPDREPDRARKAFESHLADTKLMTKDGYRHSLRRGWPRSAHARRG